MIRGDMPIPRFAEKFGIHKSTLIRYEKDETAPDAKFLVKLCEEYKLSSEWLLLGEGPKGKEEAKKGGDEWSDNINDRFFQSVITLVDFYLDTIFYMDMAPDIKAKIYFYVHSNCKDSKTIRPQDICEALNIFYGKSTMIYDVEIVEKAKLLADIKLGVDSKPTERNKAYWKVIDEISDEFYKSGVIAPISAKNRALKWLEERISSEERKKGRPGSA